MVRRAQLQDLLGSPYLLFLFTHRWRYLYDEDEAHARCCFQKSVRHLYQEAVSCVTCHQVLAERGPTACLTGHFGCQSTRAECVRSTGEWRAFLSSLRDSMLFASSCSQRWELRAFHGLHFDGIWLLSSSTPRKFYISALALISRIGLPNALLWTKLVSHSSLSLGYRRFKQS